jgi:hypothetical protein
MRLYGFQAFNIIPKIIGHAHTLESAVSQAVLVGT